MTQVDSEIYRGPAGVVLRDGHFHLLNVRGPTTWLRSVWVGGPEEMDKFSAGWGPFFLWLLGLGGTVFALVWLELKGLRFLGWPWLCWAGGLLVVYLVYAFVDSLLNDERRRIKKVKRNPVFSILVGKSLNVKKACRIRAQAGQPLVDLEPLLTRHRSVLITFEGLGDAERFELFDKLDRHLA